MWLVLAQDNDVEAQWVAAGLRARADRPVVLVTASTLVHDCRCEHRVGAAGASSRLELGDGTVLDPTTVDGVVNRLCWLGAEGFTGASDHDREYATAELYALGLSWLESLGHRVVNRPAGNGMAGSWRRPGEWRSRAREAGLAVVPFDSDPPEGPLDPTDHVVLVLDGEVIEPAPRLAPADRERLAALQRAAGLDLLEARFAGAAFRAASFLASFSRYGDRGLDALHKALMVRSGVDR